MVVKPASANDYYELLRRLSPPGVSWADGGRWEDLLRASAVEMARHHARCETVEAEADPRTADEVLAFWERSLGITDPATSLADRRLEAYARMLASGGCSVPYFTELASAMGITVTIQEPLHQGWNPGSPMGTPFYSSSARFVWIVTAPAGTSADLKAAMEQLFGLIKPAQTRVFFSYV